MIKLISCNSIELITFQTNSFFQVLFPIFKEHHEQIEEQAEKAKVSIKDKLEIFFKKDKTDKTDKIVRKGDKSAKEELKKL